LPTYRKSYITYPKSIFYLTLNFYIKVKWQCVKFQSLTLQKTATFINKLFYVSHDTHTTPSSYMWERWIKCIFLDVELWITMDALAIRRCACCPIRLCWMLVLWGWTRHWRASYLSAWRDRSVGLLCEIRRCLFKDRCDLSYELLLKRSVNPFPLVPILLSYEHNSTVLVYSSITVFRQFYKF